MRTPSLRGVVVAIALCPAVLAAQARPQLSGRVVDGGTDAAIHGATVELLSETGRRSARAVTDSAGTFAMTAPGAGRFVFAISAAGYADVTSAVLQVESADVLGVVLRMNVQAVALPALEVVARSRPTHRDPGVQSFHYRMARAMGGTFITKEELESRAPSRLSQIIGGAGVVVWGDEMSDGGIVMGRTNCVPIVYVDGVPMNHPHLSVGRPQTRDNVPAMQALQAVNMINPRPVEGIEVYRGAASLPAEFGGSTGQCGVIAIWLRRG